MAAPPVKNIWLHESLWKRTGLAGNGTPAETNEVARRREAILDHFLTIHQNMGANPNYLLKDVQAGLRAWFRYLWPQISPHVPKMAGVSTEKAQVRVKDVFIRYKSTWRDMGVNIVPPGTAYTAPPDGTGAVSSAGPGVIPTVTPQPLLPPSPGQTSAANATPSPLILPQILYEPPTPPPAAPAPAPAPGPVPVISPIGSPLPVFHYGTPETATQTAPLQSQRQLLRSRTWLTPNSPRIFFNRTVSDEERETELRAQLDDFSRLAQFHVSEFTNMCYDAFNGLQRSQRAIDISRYETFASESHVIAELWARWNEDCMRYIEAEWRQASVLRFWELAKGEGKVDVVDTLGQTLDQHNEQMDIITHEHRQLVTEESRVLRLSNLILMEFNRQVTSPRNELEWQHRIEWEEFGFDYSANSTRFNAHYNVILASSGQVIGDEYTTLHTLLKDRLDPTSVSHNMLWVNGTQLRFSGLRDVLHRHHYLGRHNSIWLRTTPTEKDWYSEISQPRGEYRINNDLELVRAVQLVMAHNWPQFTGRRPKQGRHHTGSLHPILSFIIREDPPSPSGERIRIEDFAAAAFQRSRRDLELAEYADHAQNLEARRSHILASISSFMSPSPPPVDFSEFINELAYDNDDAKLLALVSGATPGMDPPAESNVQELDETIRRASASPGPGPGN